MPWLGIDIGGANLKLATPAGYADTRPFELWRHPEQLAAALGEAIAAAPTADSLAITITGELADCFTTKAEGIRSIVTAAEQAARHADLWIYGVDGEFRSVTDVKENPLPAAASNWHALARYAGRFAPTGNSVLIDIGSTTTDLIPLRDGALATTSRSDTDRLLAGELVYSGVGRTPLCAVVDALPYRGRWCPVAAELFATTADAYFLLDKSFSRDNGKHTHAPTADGRPMTVPHASDRMARMLCADRTTFQREDALRAATAVHHAQLLQLNSSFKKIATKYLGGHFTAILSGSGAFLAQDLLQQYAGRVTTVIDLRQQAGEALSQAAPAWAVAVLASESPPS